MKKLIPIILAIALLPAVIPVSAALAADITDAVFFGTVRGTNSSTVASDVSVNLSINTDAWIDNGTLNATATNVAILNNTGADAEFMPGYENNPWAVQFDTVPDNGNIDFTVYTNATGGKIRYFPGTGGMNVPDDPSLEIGDNFSMSITGFVNTDNGTDKNIVTKNGSMSMFVSPTVSENISAQLTMVDTFKDDNWTDVGTKIQVNTTTQRLEYESELSAVIAQSYKDVGLQSDTEWTLEFELTNTASNGAGFFFFGLWETIEDVASIASDAIVLVVQGDTPVVNIQRWDEGGGAASGSITITDGVISFYRLSRVAADNVSLSVFSDESRTVHISGSPVTLTIASSIQNLTFLMAQNWASGAGAGLEEIGFLDNVGLDSLNITLSVAGVASAERTVELSADGANATLSIDGATSGSGFDTVALNPSLLVADTSANWTFFSFIDNDSPTLNYVETANVSVNGTQAGSWEWELAATFTDASGNGNTATPTFRTESSDPDVSASLISFAPVSLARATGNATVVWPSSLPGGPPTEPSTAFTEDARPGIFFEPLVFTMAEFGASNWSGISTSILEQLFWYAFSFILIILISVGVYFAFAANAKEALFVKIFATSGIMIFFALPGINIYGLYVPIYYALFATGIMMLKKDRGW